MTLTAYDLAVTITRKLFFPVAFLLSCFMVNAQKQDLPEFGKVSAQELQMKECSFEKDASAMYLINEENISFKQSTYSYDTKTIYERRVRIKVFNKKGFDYASIVIRDAKTNSSKITDLDAYIYNLTPDGKIVSEKVDKDQVFKEKAGKRKTNSLRFTFPDLQPGSVIEYRYTKVKKNSFALEPWFFQDLIPVQVSACRINLLPGIELNTRLVTTQLAEEDSSVTTEGSNSKYTFKTFVLHKVPSFTAEPYMTSVSDNLERAEFFMYPSMLFMFAHTPEAKWNMIGTIMKEFPFFGGQFYTPVEGTEHAVDSIKQLPSDSEKINAVYELVKQNVKWNDEQLFFAENIQNAWDTKSGSSAEINILMLNLLSKVGISCRPLLISTKDNGKPDKDFPTLGQFNGVDVLITDSINNFILDGTQQYQPYFIPPLNILNSDAFLIGTPSTWVTISDDRHLMKSSTYIRADLDSNGVLHGTAEITMENYAKAEELKEKEKDDYEKKEEEKDFLKYDNADIVIDSIEKNDTVAISESLHIKIKFHYTLTNNDDYYFLNPYFFSMFRKNPFTSNERRSDIDLGCAQKFLTYIMIDIPGNFSVEDVSKSVFLLTADTSLSFRKDVSNQDNRVGLRYQFEVNNPLFTKENYPGVKGFFDKIYGIINQQVLLKKKQ